MMIRVIHFVYQLTFVLFFTQSAVAQGPVLPKPNKKPTGPMRPNIILIVADDLGFGDLGSYGQQYIKTPHLDLLAAEGIRFTQAYAGAPIGSASRASLMTGLHTGHSYIRGNKIFLYAQVISPLRRCCAKHVTKRWHLGNGG